MKEDKIALYSNLAGIAISTGLAVITQGSSQLMLSVVNSISSNLASSFIEKTEYAKIKKLAGDYDPSTLNHDLKKLIINAVEWAIKNIEVLYKKNLNDKQQAQLLKTTIKDILQNVKLYPSSATQTDNDWLRIAEKQEQPTEAFEIFRISINSLPVINADQPFPIFLQEQFVPNLQLCFGELLKAPRNRPAYIAYQRLVYDNINERIDKLLAQNENILKGLSEKKETNDIPVNTLRNLQKNIRSSSTVIKNKYLDKALKEYLSPVEQKVELLVDVTADISHDVKDIKAVTATFEKKLGDNWISKYKVLVLGLGAVLLIAITGFVLYFKSRPFNANVNLMNEAGLKINPAYPVVDKDAKLIVHLPGEIKSYAVGAGMNILLPDLSSTLKNKQLKAELSDPYWKLVNDSININESTNLFIKPNDKLARVYGIVRSWDANEFITRARIEIYGDTSVYSDANGRFDISLHESQRKPGYKLIVSAKGYITVDESMYYPGTPIEFRMKKIGKP